MSRILFFSFVAAVSLCAGAAIDRFGFPPAPAAEAAPGTVEVPTNVDPRYAFHTMQLFDGRGEGKKAQSPLYLVSMAVDPAERAAKIKESRPGTFVRFCNVWGESPPGNDTWQLEVGGMIYETDGCAMF